MGSNNHPGDYRSSGCTACHVIYANDRSPTQSGWYSKYGNQGLSFSGDKAIRNDERGHPIKHEFTRAIPTSQCMNCHMHQGNLFVNPYLGYTWWDQETRRRIHVSEARARTIRRRAGTRPNAQSANNPEAAAARGLWGDLDFLEKVAELNPKLKNTQFADYHGHGWIFRAVFKHDRQGNLRDLDDNIIPPRRPGEIRQGGASEGRASRERHAMRRLPFRRGRPRQRHALRRTARGHDHRVHRLPRHDHQAPDARHHRQRRLGTARRSRIDLHAKQHAVGSAFFLGRQKTFPTLDDDAGPDLGSAADDGHD